MKDFKKPKRNKKIAIIFEDGRMGGPHKQIIYFLNKLNNIEIKNYSLIVPSGYRKKFLKLLVNKNFKIYEFNFTVPSIKKIFIYCKNFMHECYKLKKLLNKKNFDKVYVAEGTIAFKSIISSIAAKTQIIWHIHDCSCNIFIKLIFYLLKNKVEKIIFASNRSKQYYLGNYNNNKSSILTSSIDINKFKKKFKNKVIYIGLISNISPNKGVELYFKIVNNIKITDVKFFLIGNLWETQKKYFFKICKKYPMALKKIYWISNNDNPIEIISRLDITLCTSISESMPLAICESMSSSSAIISCDVGDIKQYIEIKNLRAGVIIKKRDASLYIKNIEKFFKFKNILRKYQSNSRIVAKKFFDIKRYTINLNKILTS